MKKLLAAPGIFLKPYFARQRRGILADAILAQNPLTGQYPGLADIHNANTIGYCGTNIDIINLGTLCVHPNTSALKTCNNACIWTGLTIEQICRSCLENAVFPTIPTFSVTAAQSRSSEIIQLSIAIFTRTGLPQYARFLNLELLEDRPWCEVQEQTWNVRAKTQISFPTGSMRADAPFFQNVIQTAIAHQQYVFAGYFYNPADKRSDWSGNGKIWTIRYLPR